MGRLPHSQNGLNFYEQELLNGCSLSDDSVWAVTLVIRVMEMEYVSDFYIYWLLKNLSAPYARKPAFIIKTHPEKEGVSLMGRQYVTLTEYGKDRRDGRTNWLNHNDVDYCVGGILVTSPNNSYYSDDILKNF